MVTIQLVINNEKRSAANGKVFERINPITGKIVTRTGRIRND